jgi:hypothetical protein
MVAKDVPPYFLPRERTRQSIFKFDFARGEEGNRLQATGNRQQATGNGQEDLVI